MVGLPSPTLTVEKTLTTIEIEFFNFKLSYFNSVIYIFFIYTYTMCYICVIKIDHINWLQQSAGAQESKIGAIRHTLK